MVDIEEWTGPGAKELPNEHRPLQPGDNCVLVLMVMIIVMLVMSLVIMMIIVKMLMMEVVVVMIIVVMLMMLLEMVMIIVM